MLLQKVRKQESDIEIIDKSLILDNICTKLRLEIYQLFQCQSVPFFLIFCNSTKD